MVRVPYSGAMSPRPAVPCRRSHWALCRTVLLVGLAVSLIAGCSDEPGSGAGTSGSPTASARPTGVQSSHAPLPTPKGTTIDVTDLKLGDCFTEPDGELVERITKVACSGPHDAEVFATPDLPSSARYPGDAAVEAQADQVCTDASGAINRDKLPGSATIGYFFPTEDNWSADDSTAWCYVATDDQPLVGSVRR